MKKSQFTNRNLDRSYQDVIQFALGTEVKTFLRFLCEKSLEQKARPEGKRPNLKGNIASKKNH